MSGSPVWLASVSHESRTTDKFSPEDRAQARAFPLWVLQGVGNERRQRFFRMCVTTCLHRALSDKEQAALPESFHAAEALDIAGGPVEIIEETEIGAPSTWPCENPTMIDLDELLGKQGRMRGAKFAKDCGECAPCRARSTCHPRSAAVVRSNLVEGAAAAQAG